MPTALDIIGPALGLLGIRTPGDAVGPAEAEVCLERLNTWLDSQRVGPLNSYATTTVTGTLPANTSIITVGPTGTIVITPRPIRIETGSFYTQDGQDWPLIPITQAQYNGILTKGIASPGEKCAFYNPSMSDGTLFVYPQASESVTLSLVCLLQLTEFADLTTNYVLPPGYRRMLVFTLAEEVAADFEREIPPTVARNAANARTAVRNANHTVPQLSTGEVPMTAYEAFLAGV